MKNLLLGLLALIAIGAGAGIYYVESKYLGIGLPWNSSVDIPEIPDLPEPMTKLFEGQSGTIYFATKSPYDFSRLLNGYDKLPTHGGVGELFLPKGASVDNPVPAIIILHGSGGINASREPVYAKLFNNLGIAALVVDYYAARGTADENHYIRKVLSATESDILVDAFAALKLLGTHPAIDAKKIGVTGYSYGGMVTRYSLDPRIKNIIAPDVPPFAIFMDFYGPCHQTLGTDATTGGAYMAIFGDRDNSVDPEVCKRVYKILEENGTSVEYHILEGAGHAWETDVPRNMTDNPYVRGCEFTYDPKSGHPLVDGKPVTVSEPDASRGERAFVRTSISLETPQCIHEGYVVGHDPQADKKAKAIMVKFLKKQGFVKPNDIDGDDNVAAKSNEKAIQ